MSGFETLVFSPASLLIVAAVWVILSAFARALPEIAGNRWYARLAPLLPILLCSGLVWVPGAITEPLGVGARVALGIVLGALASNGHKLFKQTALGQDKRIC